MEDATNWELVIRIPGIKTIRKFKCLLLLEIKNNSSHFDTINTTKLFKINFKDGNYITLLHNLKGWESS
jgi:hypothetical protein